MTDDLPPGFTYLEPPSSWPPSPWDDPRRLKLMALSLRLPLARDARMGWAGVSKALPRPPISLSDLD
jgi:hypothetical protein